MFERERERERERGGFGEPLRGHIFTTLIELQDQVKGVFEVHPGQDNGVQVDTISKYILRTGTFFK